MFLIAELFADFSFVEDFTHLITNCLGMEGLQDCWMGHPCLGPIVGFWSLYSLYLF